MADNMQETFGSVDLALCYGFYLGNIVKNTTFNVIASELFNEVPIDWNE